MGFPKTKTQTNTMTKTLKPNAGIYYLIQLPEDVQDNFLREFTAGRSIGPASYLQYEFVDMQDFLSSGFMWYNSIKGEAYWKDIAKSILISTQHKIINKQNP